ncbi:MAG: ABC transporter permease subunit [Rhodospirillales bacterium]|nr:ABC transporter permease subunit [Rhodospirillales bacterium]
MTAQEIVDVLWAWSPYLAEGFGWNIIVSLLAMAVGTVVGMLLALLRGGSHWSVRHSGGAVTTLARNAPTFVMLFYLAYIIPTEFTLFGAAATFPAWIKAALALGIAVAGYVSDNALAAIRHLRRHEMAEALLFVPAWTSYFLIIVMASSTASVIGVPELVRRADTVIGAVDEVGLALWVYLWAMIWFLGFSLILTFGMNWLSRHIKRRVHRPLEEATDLTGGPLP